MEYKDFATLHAVIRQRQEGKTLAKELAGDNSDFWGGFNRQNKDKLEMLLESIIYDMRQEHRYTNEDELLFRIAFKELQSTLEACEGELPRGS